MRSTLVALALFTAFSVQAQGVPCGEDGLIDGTYSCENVSLLAHLPLEILGGRLGNDVWGWTDSVTGREYALMGLDNGVAFVDVSDPASPSYLGNLPTHTTATIWRDFKVYGDYLFVVSEADKHGMQVFDLAHLRDIAPTQGPVRFEADAHYGRVGQSHNIAVDKETATAFIVGSYGPDGCAGGLHLVDISSPLRPVFAGCFADDGYTHDTQCIVYDGPDTDYTGREICFASNEDTVTIVDVTDRDSTVMLSQAIYPNPVYTHQGWLTEDRRFFVANDELDEMRYGHTARTLIFDVSDLDTPEFLDAYLSDLPATDHNLYIVGDLIYQANNSTGLRILDATTIADGELAEVAHFDTFPDKDAIGSGGAWSTYPFFASGTVLISDSQYGLFVVRPESPAPLALASFRASSQGQGADLSWTTSDSTHASRFYIEREMNGRWVPAGEVQAFSGRSSYRFRVGGLGDGNHAFRLRAVKTNGITAYSDTATTTLGIAEAAALETGE